MQNGAATTSVSIEAVSGRWFWADSGAKGVTVQDGCELPGQIMSVLNACVHAEAAGGREPVRSIASQQDTARCVVLDHLEAAADAVTGRNR
jgi:hypothetical protein